MKDTLKLITEIKAPSGRENYAYETMRKLFEQYGSVETDSLNNIIIKKEINKEYKTVLIDAHLDEIFLTVKEVLDGGFIRVEKFSGVDTRILLSGEFIVLADQGRKEIYCVCSTTPPHLMKEKTAEIKIEDILLDTGLENAKEIIETGDTVVFVPAFRELLNNRFCSKSFDDRACIGVILEYLKMSGEDKYNVVISLSSGEEMGQKSLCAVAEAVKPDLCIVLDVSFADAPFDLNSPGVMSKGPMIGIAPILDRDIFNKMKETAEENKIPYQTEVMNSSTGTNAWFAVSSLCGVKTALISVPIRNMHSPVEILAADDVENTARLIKLLLQKEGLI